MPDLESRLFVPIGSVLGDPESILKHIDTIIGVLRQCEVTRVHGFLNYSVLETPWTNYQLTKMQGQLHPGRDYMPVATVILTSFNRVVGLEVADKVYVGYKVRKTLRSLSVHRGFAFDESEQSAEQKAALTDLADWLRTAFEEAAAKYSAPPTESRGKYR